MTCRKGEATLTQKVEEDSSTILSLGVCSKVDLLLAELLHQLLAGAWELQIIQSKRQFGRVHLVQTPPA